VLLALAAWRLQETRPLTADGKAVSWHEIATRYGKLLRSRRYLGYTLTFGFGTSGYFGFLAVGPGLMIGALGLTPVEFSLALMTVTVQFIAGSFVSSRLVARFGVDRTLYLGAAIQLTAALALLALSPWLSVVTILLPMWLYAFSNGFIFPNAMAGGTGVDRRIAGAAASFLGFVQLGFGAVIAWAIAALPTDSIVPYGLGLVIFAGVAVSGMVLVRFSPP
jgi:MFS transporter, DHA1 family, multidrug resistance protein